MASDQTTEIEGRNEYTNLVRKVTTLDVLAEVRRAFRTMPAPDFHEWLTRRMEQAERMPRVNPRPPNRSASNRARHPPRISDQSLRRR
jgi:hypothetical protein